MARLRSDKWYAADGQQRARRVASTHTGGTRRLASLCILLGLVVVLMQKAADPRYISSAFRTLGVPLEQPVPAPTPIALASEIQIKESEFTLWHATCRNLVRRLLDETPSPEKLNIARAWFSPAGAAADEDWAQVRNRSQDTLNRLRESIDPTSEENRAWLENLERFDAEWYSLIENNFSRSGSSIELKQSLDVALDNYLISSLRDATPWQADESVAFWRLLDLASSSAASPSRNTETEVATLQLLANRNLQRGQAVTFTGDVRRYDLQTRPNPLTLQSESYFTFWIRGADNANQPVITYARQGSIDKAFEQIVLQFPESTMLDSGVLPIQFTAIVAKQLAYKAKTDLEVAPTLFIQRITASAPLAARQHTSKDKPLGNNLTWQTLAALLVSLGVYLVIRPGFRKSIRASNDRGRSRESGVGRVVFWMCTSLALSTSARATLQEPFSTLAVSDTQTPPWSRPVDRDERLISIYRAQAESVLTNEATSELHTAAQASVAGASPAPLAVLKLLQLIDKIGVSRLASLPTVALNDHEIRFAHFEGMATAVETIQLTPAQSNWFGDDKTATIYRVLVTSTRTVATAVPAMKESNLLVDTSSEDGNARRGVVASSETKTAAIYCERVPSVWLTAASIRQPVRVQGLTIGPVNANKGEQPDFAERSTAIPIVSPTIEWSLTSSPSPDSEELSPEIAEHLVAIGRAGWDLTHVDLVRNNSKNPIEPEEAVAFYSFIRTASNQPHTPENPTDSLAAIEAIKSPERNLARKVLWNVRLVSGNVVDVTSEEARLTLGGQRYYQLDGLVSMGANTVRYSIPTRTGTNERIEFEREFPITLVTINSNLVPANVRNGQQTSWEIGQHFQVEGIFYRLWAYQSDLVESKNSVARQAAPLVVANKMTPTAPPRMQRPSAIGWFGVAFCGVILLLLAMILYYALKRDTRRRRLA